MARYLLDTNHLSPLITIGHSLRTRLQAHFAQGDTFAIPTPVLSEFLFGIGSLPRARQNQTEWERIQADLEIINVDSQMAIDAATLRLKLRTQGWQLTLFDSLIAVTALRGDYTLLTTDKDFHSIPGLRQENWRDTPPLTS